MLDPGRYLAEAIYFLQYTLAQLLWLIDRALLAIAVIAEGINSWISDNVGYFVQLMVNGLSAPLGGLFILALSALGFWYALNNVLPTDRWVDPSRLLVYGVITFFFFSSPVLIIDRMEELRTALNANLDLALLDGAEGSIFDTGMDGTDVGLPPALPDVNSDGVIASFDLAAAFLLVANLDELDSSEFPVDFEAAYFPFGDPAGIDLSDEADQELAKALASDGVERLIFAWIAVPTAIAEHFLRLALTGVAVLLYLGVPIAMLFAYFIYTQAFLLAYLRQFLNLLIETFMTMIISSVMLTLLLAAALQGIGLYLAASLITLFVLLWRLKSALRLGSGAFDLFGGAMLTGGAGGRELLGMGARATAGTLAAAGAAMTAGGSLALGGAALTAARMVQADGRADGAYLGTDPDKSAVRARQLQTIAGYSLGRSPAARNLIENAHEARTLGRNFRDGTVVEGEPDMLDYMRAGSVMSGFGSSPWLAMRMSPSLRGAFDQIGGSHRGYGLLDDSFDEDAPVGSPAGPRLPRQPAMQNQPPADEWQESDQPLPDWLAEETPTWAHRPEADIHLESLDDERRRLLPWLLTHLNDGDPHRQAAARQTLVQFSGEDNAQEINGAVTTHTAEAASNAALAIDSLLASYRSEGLSNRDILAAFRAGDAIPRLREQLEIASTPTPLADPALHALADLVMMPQRRLERGEFVRLLAEEVSAGERSEEAVAVRLGSPVGFGGHTGVVRGVMAGTAAMQLEPDALEQMAEQLREGLWLEAQARLTGQGHRPGQVNAFLSDLAALPSTIIVPQTTAASPTPTETPEAVR